MARSKKDIDRELMYKKILPTAAPADGKEAAPLNISSATLEVNIQKPIEVIVSSPHMQGHFQRLTEEQPEETPVFQAQDRITQVDSSEEAAPADLQAEAALDEMPLANLMEAFVEKRLDAALKKFKCCTCERCRKDVLAIALNKLPPLYVTEKDPDIRDLHERERAAQVATALVQAILATKANPTHEINQ